MNYFFSTVPPDEILMQEVTVSVANKEEYNKMTKAIVDNLLTGKKILLIAIASLIATYVVGKLAYHTDWGQLVLIILVMVFLISTVMGINLFRGYKSTASYFVKSADKIQYPNMFLCQFYERGLYTKCPDLEGYFSYECFHNIGVSKGGMQFLFRFKNSPIGLQLRKKFMVDTLWLPFGNMSEQEIKQLAEFMKELNKKLRYIKIDKAIEIM